MNASSQPLNYIWWLIGRASGVVAMVLISLAVVMGLAMAAKAIKRPGVKRAVAKLHEHVALTALGAIGVHGLSLLQDPWLKPGWKGITVPFAMSYRPVFTGVGNIAAYAALLFGPSFYLRRRIGVRRWRKVHGLLIVAWLMSGMHTLGAGSDGRKLWLEAVVAAPVVPVVYLLVLRVLCPAAGAAKRVESAKSPGAVPVRPRPTRVTKAAEAARA